MGGLEIMRDIRHQLSSTLARRKGGKGLGLGLGLGLRVSAEKSYQDTLIKDAGALTRPGVN